MTAERENVSKVKRVFKIIGFFFYVPVIGGMWLLAVIVALATGVEKAYRRCHKKKGGSIVHKFWSAVEQVFPLLWMAFIVILGMTSKLAASSTWLLLGSVIAGWCVTARVKRSRFDELIAAIFALFIIGPGVGGLIGGYSNLFLYCAVAPAIGALIGLVHKRQIERQIDNVIDGGYPDLYLPH